MATEGREGTATYPSLTSSDSSEGLPSSGLMAASSASQNHVSPNHADFFSLPPPSTSRTGAAGPTSLPWSIDDTSGVPNHDPLTPSTRTGETGDTAASATDQWSTTHWSGVPSPTQPSASSSPPVIDPSVPPRDSYMEYTASHNLPRAAEMAAALSSTSQTPQTPQQGEQNIVLPRWQPDAEATYCPICHTQFSIFLRKHHCRKCGRVVCGACSPHRIIIPYQYIVRPPNAPASRRPAAVVAVAGGTARRGSGPAAGAVDSLGRGGGERVRLCNPCVPDPNMAPPQSPATSGALSSNTLPRSHSQSLGNHGAGGSNSLSLQRPLPPVQHSGYLPAILGTFASNFGSAPEQNSLQQGTAFYGNDPSNTAAGNGLLVPPLAGAGGRYPYNIRGSHRASSGSGGRTSSNRESSIPPPSFFGAQPRARHQDQLLFQFTAQQREHEQEQERERERERAPIPEEDECPVCRRELPSASLPNAETLRENHINQCIESFSNSGRRSHSHSGASGPSDESGSSMLHPSSPPLPPLPPRGTGMFPYRATEKDCVDDAECTICLEEFVVGVPMARLECFCRFHEKCIRLWFQTRPGRCPVHQHDGYGF